MHVHDIDCLQFVREKMETPGALDKTVEEKRLIMRRLTKACGFVSFKRFFSQSLDFRIL